MAKAKKETYAIITRSLVSSGKFLKQPKGAALLAKCKLSDGGPACGYGDGGTTPTEDHLRELEERQEELELIRDYLERTDQWNEILSDYGVASGDVAMRDFVTAAQEDVGAARQRVLQHLQEEDRELSKIQSGLIRDDFERAEERLPMFVSTVELDVIDVTGLEGREASTLSAKLLGWNKGVKKVFTRRNGRRYISPSIYRMDLNDPFIQSMPFYEELRALVDERKIPVFYEDISKKSPPRRAEKPRAPFGGKKGLVPRDTLELQAETLPKAKRKTSEEVTREARVARRGLASQEGLGMPVAYSVGDASQEPVL